MILIALTLAASLRASANAPNTPVDASGDAAKVRVWDFEDTAPGALPASWRVEATRPHGPLATWEVVEDPTTPSGTHALALTHTRHTSASTFNLCWTNAVSFLDGEIEVRFKALTGREDQGGGVIWRVRDKDNYLIARFNPLEDNFRIYTVHDGDRRTVASARVTPKSGTWHTLKIVQRGDRFEGSLDGKKVLEGTDDLFKAAGGVGLWTKADAVTSFDLFTLRP